MTTARGPVTVGCVALRGGGAEPHPAGHRRAGGRAGTPTTNAPPASPPTTASATPAAFRPCGGRPTWRGRRRSGRMSSVTALCGTTSASTLTAVRTWLCSAAPRGRRGRKRTNSGSMRRSGFAMVSFQTSVRLENGRTLATTPP